MELFRINRKVDSLDLGSSWKLRNKNLNDCTCEAISELVLSIQQFIKVKYSQKPIKFSQKYS